MSTATDRRAIDAYAVALNETEYYNIDAADRRFIERIDGVYVFDRNEHTHCCELTPSYFLIYAYTCIVFTADADDAARDDLQDKYAYQPSDDIYMHCHTVDRLVAAGTRDTVSHYGDVFPNGMETDVDDPDDRHSLEMEHIREDLNCNSPF